MGGTWPTARMEKSRDPRPLRGDAAIYRIDVIPGRRGECYNGDPNRIGGVFSGNRRHFFATADSESSK